MADNINYTIRDFDGYKIIDLMGNLSANTVRSFETVVRRIIENESVILNMVNVKVVTSAGLNSLMDMSFEAKERGTRVILLWAGEDLLELVDTLDVYSNLIFADSPEECKLKIKHYT